MTDRTQSLEAMYQSILDGDDELAERLARDALASGMPPLEAIDGGFIPGRRANPASPERHADGREGGEQ